jgi:hypothetical protein
MAHVTATLIEQYWVISYVINLKSSSAHAHPYGAVCVVSIKNDHLIISQPQRVVRTNFLWLVKRQFVVTQHDSSN